MKMQRKSIQKVVEWKEKWRPHVNINNVKSRQEDEAFEREDEDEVVEVMKYDLGDDDEDDELEEEELGTGAEFSTKGDEKDEIAEQFKKNYKVLLDPEDLKEARRRWRVALSDFRPFRAIVESGTEQGALAVKTKYEEALTAAEKDDYDLAHQRLQEATDLAKRLKEDIRQACAKVAKETKEDEKMQVKVFTFNVKIEDKKWGFDSDTDAPNFYLANSVDEFGGKKLSPQLNDMNKVYAQCLERHEQLARMGASIDEIVEAVYKNIPKNFWPDSVVKEVILFEAVRKEIETEEALKQSQIDLQKLTDEGVEREEQGGEVLEETHEWLEVVEHIKKIEEMRKKKEEEKSSESKDSKPTEETPKTETQGDGENKDTKPTEETPKSESQGGGGEKPTELSSKAEGQGEEEEKPTALSETSEALQEMAHTLLACTGGFKGALKGFEAMKTQKELWDTEDNPVKEKILEFQRNKAIIDCINSLAGAGLHASVEEVVKEVIPVLNAVLKGKDALMEIGAAVTYFNNLHEIAKLKKGAKLDPRTASLRPLARQAREQKIKAADSVVKAVSHLLEMAGKTVQAAGITAPAGVAVDIAGKVIRYGGVIVIQGIKWGDAARAVKSIKLAIGPPPNRKAQFEVMQNSTKYARVALAQLGRDGDPWAIGHLMNMGLGREDIDHPATTTKLLREYMALKSGGLLAEGIEEEQQTIGESLPGRAVKFIGRGIVKGGEKLRDKIVGRDTSIPYDPNWEATGELEVTSSTWNVVRQNAIQAGWYDSRPDIGSYLSELGGAVGQYIAFAKHNLPTNEGDFKEAVDAATETLVALDAVRIQLRKIKPVTNDRSTPHEGMQKFLVAWYGKVMERSREVSEQRAKWIDRIPLRDDDNQVVTKEQYLENAKKKAREQQKQKVKERRTKVYQLLTAHKFPTPYGTATLGQFPEKAKKKLRLDEKAAGALVGEVGKLATLMFDRLCVEVMAAPDDEALAEAFKLSVKNLEPLVVEQLRDAAEDVYDKAGLTEPESDWTHVSAQVSLSKEAWAGVKQSASEAGWDKAGDTGLTPALENLEKAAKKFNDESQRTEIVRVNLDQALGVVLGRIDELAKALKNFQPLTGNKFVHHGLANWRDRMIDLCLSERQIYQATLDDL